jgi:vacuolar protein sorting-associated protein 33A
MVSTTPNTGGGINIESIKANALKDLLDVVDSVRGKKALVLDPSLTGPLGLVVKFSLLRDHGIDKVFHLAPSPLAVPQDKIIYLCRPQQRNAQMILGNRTPFASSILPLRTNPQPTDL